MVKSVDQVVREVSLLVEPILDEMAFELVDIEFIPDRGRWILRIYLDKEGGITLDDCALVSRELGDLIDVKDVFPGKYSLEISSPGLNRPLKKEKDFLKAVGRKVKVKTIVPVKGCRNFTGHLRNFQDGVLYLDVDNNLIPLSLRDVKKAHLAYEGKL